MKQLFLVRHAKSSWKYPELSDFERPLNKRGKRDAPNMGQLLKRLGILPDLILSSPAVRAKKTAKILSKEMGYPTDHIDWRQEIYHAGQSQLLSIVRSVDDKHQSLMLVGHNPGFTWFSNQLTGHYLENIPTCGVVSINFSLNSWSDVDYEQGKFLSFDYPKKFLNL